MTDYARLLAAVWERPAVAESPPLSLPPELELQALWFAGAFGRDFRDTAGTTIRVVQFGEWNRSAGPDFLHAAIETGSEVHRGPIELDMRPSDWEAHGHGADPAFGDTVLHVVFSHGGPESFTRTHDHREVPRVVIPRDLLEQALQQPRRETAIATPGRCVLPLANMPPVSVAALLREAAEHRAARKAARLLRTTDAHGRDAALYQAVAETLGYRSNALAMRLLSQRMPLAALREEPAHTEALLFGAAGFLSPDLHEKAPPDTREHLRGLWETWWKVRGQWESAHAIPWKAGGQRPANHPHRRVAALAAIVREWPKFRKLATSLPLDADALVKMLSKLDDPFWTRRYTLSSAAAARPLALFGKAQAIELLANHLFPLALHEGESYERYAKLAAGARNEKVRRCAIRLFGSEDAAGTWLKKAAHHQAMLQIYHDFCLEDSSDCANCPFPEQLAQWRNR
ncbi:DUF2851 family protein [Luteolibacter flavescens]|uniref:DUF2851 family protein n=1 Tax=Luteolibacter flavescens TaxID=1859460 RepID=A0ABT3FL40_9BACT|nr:DUF2851 family protein [Luteolibacter flavescens]MCW1884306.1 DUF2851 family protein [Luteolibacter flavescens]